MATIAVEKPVFDAAADAAKDVYRSVQRSMRHAVDLRDDTAYRVRRAPMTSIGIAFGGGVLLGAMLVFVGERLCPASLASADTARPPQTAACQPEDGRGTHAR